MNPVREKKDRNKKGTEAKMNIFNLIQGRLGRFVPYDSPTRQVFNGVKKMSFLVLVLVGLITMAGSPFVEAAEPLMVQDRESLEILDLSAPTGCGWAISAGDADKTDGFGLVIDDLIIPNQYYDWGSFDSKVAIVMGPDIDPDFNSVEKERAQPSVNPTPNPYPAPEYLVLDSGDYDGDGISDIAIFRPNSGLWAVRGLGRVYFGTERG